MLYDTDIFQTSNLCYCNGTQSNVYYYLPTSANKLNATIVFYTIIDKYNSIYYDENMCLNCGKLYIDSVDL